MFVDIAKVIVSSGNGGNGKVSFRAEYGVQYGGSDGGHGGKGGDVYLYVDPSQSTLFSYQHQSHRVAGHGDGGGPERMTGRSGEDLLLPVPPGTLVYNDETGELLCELIEKGSAVLLLYGGRGGKGNSHFKRSTFKTPKFAELGEPGKTLRLRFELSLVADIGIIGFPSAGKSSLIACISAAKPKIAEYHFTTLVPNLGVVSAQGFSFVVADIPGIIEGASEGRGLGFEFLRHVYRCRSLVHLIDGSLGTVEEMIESYEILLREMHSYNAELSDRPRRVYLSKCDLHDAETQEYLCQTLSAALGTPVLPLSTASHLGIDGLLHTLSDDVRNLPQMRYSQETQAPAEALQDVFQASVTDFFASDAEQELSEDEDAFVVPDTTPECKRHGFRTCQVIDPDAKIDVNAYRWYRQEDGSFRVEGRRLEQLAIMTDPNSVEAMDRLYDILCKKDIDLAMHKKGARPWDTIYILDREMIYRDRLRKK